jgi:hypothetical protein
VEALTLRAYSSNSPNEETCNAWASCRGRFRPHIYADPGMCTITLNVADNDTSVGTTAVQIEVVDAAEAIAVV